MRFIPSTIGALLGLLFVFAGGSYLLGLMPQTDAPPAGSLPALFMGAFVPSGYMAVVKVLELLGGILVAVPASRALGLLVLGPIVVNVLLFQICILQGTMLLDPALVFMTGASLYLLWVERRVFAGFVPGRRQPN
jgi:putative oxidoreductase